ncbi:MAG: hypothetical protein Kow00127_22340 [Bacteroidales bacterium]
MKQLHRLSLRSIKEFIGRADVPEFTALVLTVLLTGIFFLAGESWRTQAIFTFSLTGITLLTFLSLRRKNRPEEPANHPSEAEPTNENRHPDPTPVISTGHRKTEPSAEELRRINAAKDKFFSIIAHDLKNPFNSLIGFSDLLMSDWDHLEDEEKRQYLRIIHEASTHSFDLLENLLLWSRAQSGVMRLSAEPVELGELAGETLKVLKPVAIKKGITLIHDFPGILLLQGDREMLATVFRNLVSNAIKFTSPGGRVKITGRGRNGKAVVSVIDTGVGMNEEQIECLFRIDRQRTTRGTGNESGTGLGLILCHDFVQRHQGSIQVTSEKKNGSEFKVTLPGLITKANPDEANQPAKRETATVTAD